MIIINNINITGTELKVSPLCMGTSGIGSTFDEKTSYELMDMFYEKGGNFLDTAHNYADWACSEKSISEKTIGKWMKRKKNREKIIIGTKIAQINMENLHVRLKKEELESDLDECLQYLKTDYIDLLWLHRDDTDIPVGYIMDMLNRQVEKGKIRYYGCSNWSAKRINKANEYAEDMKFAGFVANQPMWSCALINKDNLSDQTICVMDDEMFNMHKKHQLTAITFTSQARGYFSKVEKGMNKPLDPIYKNTENDKRFERIKKVACKLSCSVNQVCLRYIKTQPFPVVPIIGYRDKKQLEMNMESLDFKLDPKIKEYIKGKTNLF